MSAIEFKAWPKISRLNRNITITEKLDGTNAAVGVVLAKDDDEEIGTVCLDVHMPDHLYRNVRVYAQSRTRLITPKEDNHGFAKWVDANAYALAETLGMGLHFGEFWGSGIQRGYGLLKGEKRFSLFNTIRYNDPEKFNLAPLKDIGVDTVPVLYEGLFNEFEIKLANDRLVRNGSSASPGFMDPEGIIVFHVASQTPYKVTIKGDEKPKGSTN